MLKSPVAALILFASGPAFARTSLCEQKAHVEHAIVTDEAATCTLSKLYEGASFCLADLSGLELASKPFAVAPAAPGHFNLVFDGSADFNLEYALTCVAADGASAQSPKTIFLVGADGPGTPKISVVDLYGAKGSWSSEGGKIDFKVEF